MNRGINAAGFRKQKKDYDSFRFLMLFCVHFCWDGTEINVLRLLVEGMTYKEMGEKLGVTSDCVKKHIGNMLSKTGFTSKTKLAAMVMSKRVIVNGF